MKKLLLILPMIGMLTAPLTLVAGSKKSEKSVRSWLNDQAGIDTETAREKVPSPVIDGDEQAEVQTATSSSASKKSKKKKKKKSHNQLREMRKMLEMMNQAKEVRESGEEIPLKLKLGLAAGFITLHYMGLGWVVYKPLVAVYSEIASVAASVAGSVFYELPWQSKLLAGLWVYGSMGDLGRSILSSATGCVGSLFKTNGSKKKKTVKLGDLKVAVPDDSSDA